MNQLIKPILVRPVLLQPILRTKCREKTVEEIREEFLDHTRELVDYWNNSNEPSTKEKLSGLAFSMLVTLDGGSSDLPSYIVAPLSTEDDKQFYIENGENYYPIIETEIESDIAGCLHELFYK